MWTDKRNWNAVKKDEHLLSKRSPNTSTGAECSGKRKSRKPFPSSTAHLRVPEHSSRSTAATGRRQEKTMVGGSVADAFGRHASLPMRHRIARAMHQEAEEAQKFSRRGHRGDLPHAQQQSAHTARASHHRHVLFAGLRDPVDHSRSELGPQETIPKQAVRVQADLLLVDDEKAAWLRLVCSYG